MSLAPARNQRDEAPPSPLMAKALEAAPKLELEAEPESDSKPGSEPLSSPKPGIELSLGVSKDGRSSAITAVVANTAKAAASSTFFHIMLISSSLCCYLPVFRKLVVKMRSGRARSTLICLMASLVLWPVCTLRNSFSIGVW